jgi:hypothetical protein
MPREAAIYEDDRVLLVPLPGHRSLTFQGIGRLFDGRGVLLVQIHEDDLRVSLGPVLDAIAASSEVCLFSFVNDPEGIRDDYLDQYLARRRELDPASCRPGSSTRRELRSGARARRHPAGSTTTYPAPNKRHGRHCLVFQE